MQTPSETPSSRSSPEPQKISKSGLKLILILVILAVLSAFALLTKTSILPNYFDIGLLEPFNAEDESMELVGKPVIYLYPETQQDIYVKLNFKGTLIADFPKYDTQINGWKVSASPDGKLINYGDNQEYSYIFWEGISEKKIDWNLSEGFIVKWEDAREFLQEKLSYMGLSPKEYNEFIVYWYPQMQNNPYNLIHFADTQYTETAPLTITPTPDSMLRVFMVYKPLQEKVSIKEQQLTTFERKGFTVIEWGGTEVR